MSQKFEDIGFFFVDYIYLFSEFLDKILEYKYMIPNLMWHIYVAYFLFEKPQMTHHVKICECTLVTSSKEQLCGNG